MAGELELRGFQRRWLRGRAHDLDPVVHVGKSGLGDALLRQVDEALGAHELIKLRFVEPREKGPKQELATRICEELGAGLAGLVGHVAILYRPKEDPAERAFELPSREED